MQRLLFLILLGAAGAFLVRAYAVEGIVIATGSMEPTLPVGRRAFLNKLAYKFKSPKRGDIIVFPSPVEKKDLVKRIIGLPGDNISIDKKMVYVNGQKLEENYVKYTRPDELLKGDDLDVGLVPPGRVFVLGDNRDQSGDSRDWVDASTGAHIFFVDEKDIRGEYWDFP